MAGRGFAAAAAALAIAGAARAGGPELDVPCELARADRARSASLRCVACHGDTADALLPRGEGWAHANHPVGVDYGRVAAQQPGDFVRPALLPPDVPLVDGKVACTSCHDGASPRRGRTVDPASLCTSCHRM